MGRRQAARARRPLIRHNRELRGLPRRLWLSSAPVGRAVGKGRVQVRFSRVRRAGALVLGVTFGVFGAAGAAFAHVTISPGSAQQGGFTVVTFRVPTESD